MVRPVKQNSNGSAPRGARDSSIGNTDQQAADNPEHKTVVPAKGRAIVLVSGGLDSVVSLAIADKELHIRLVLFCNYGQRALSSERAAVVGVAGYYGLPFQEVDVSWLGDLSPVGMRVQHGDGKREHGGGTSRDQRESNADRLDSVDDVWIPNRNGIFLNVAAAFAERYDCGTVVAGFNREEAVEFADNSPGFVDAVNRGFGYSTRGNVRVAAYTLDWTKREILRKGIEVSAPLSTIWSCYRSGEKMCGTCASCRRLKAAIDALPGEQRPQIEFLR